MILGQIGEDQVAKRAAERIYRRRKKGNVGIDQKSQAQSPDRRDSSTRHVAVLQAPSLRPFGLVG
jgi:hypothetical protein